MMYNFGQFGNMFQQFPQPNNFQNQSQFITKQVTNIDEAKAYIVDPFNSYLFVDINSGKIYLKKMNNNGMSDFYIFSIEENVKQDPFAEINRRLDNIENKLGGINVQSISNDTESKSVSIGTDEKSESKTVPKSSGNDKR